MQSSELQRLHARCNPYEALPVDDDERYVDVDDVMQVDLEEIDEELRPRRYAWIDHIATKFERSQTPRQVLLTGLPGSGKTTELRRVAARLGRADGARLLTVYIDAEQVIDIDQRIDGPEIILAVVAETERAVLRLEAKHDTSVELGHEGPFKRLWNYICNTTIELNKAGATTEAANVVLALKTDPSLRKRVRDAVAARTSEFLEQARLQMRELEARVKKYEIPGQREHKYAGVFVLFDSLEKLRGLSNNFREVLESGEHVMRHNAELLKLGVHALYTVPIAISRRVDGVNLMPLIKVYDREGAPFAPGVAAMRRLVDKRLPPETLFEIFGPQYEARVKRMIEQSGGYPRELVELLRGALEESRLPLGPIAFNRLLGARVDEYARKVTTEALPLLLQVARARGRFTVSDEQRELAERLLTDSLVFVYQNEIEWADINPALASLLTEAQ